MKRYLMKWITQNWLKVGVVLSLGVISLSVAYYFCIFLPTELRNKEEHRLEVECRELGEKIYKEMNEQYPVDPQYHYNKKLKKGIYYGGGRTADSQYVGEYLIDIYTNKEIAYCFSPLSISKRRKVDWDAIHEFEAKKKELFEESDDSKRKR